MWHPVLTKNAGICSRFQRTDYEQCRFSDEQCTRNHICVGSDDAMFLKDECVKKASEFRARSGSGERKGGWNKGKGKGWGGDRYEQGQSGDWGSKGKGKGKTKVCFELENKGSCSKRPNCDYCGPGVQ